MLSILCVRLTIKVKVGTPESFKVGWYPPKKLGRVTLKPGTIPQLKKTHLKFCRRYLEISNKALNVASRRELGRLSLIINIYKNILYFILYLLRKNEDTIVNQAFRTSLELHCNGKNSFNHNLLKITEYYDLPDFDPNNLSEAKIKHYIDIIKQKYITYWQHTIHHSKKLQFYSLFKHDYKFQVI